MTSNKIFSFKHFLLEQTPTNLRMQGTKDESSGMSITLDAAIAHVEQKQKKVNPRFLEFLKSPFAKKFSSHPYELISTPTQLTRGTFMFTMKGSKRNVAIAMFSNGYVRSVPYGNSSQSMSQVLANPTDVFYFSPIQIQLKSSMEKDLEEIKSIDVYELMSNFVIEKLDESASPEDFPSFKRVVKHKKVKSNSIVILDKQGSELATCGVKKSQLLIQPGKSPLKLYLQDLDGKDLSNCFFDYNTINYLDVNAFRCKMNGAVISARGMTTEFYKSDLNESLILIPKSSYAIAGTNFIKIYNSNANKAVIDLYTSEHVYVDGKHSVLDDATLKIQDGTINMNLENCSVKNLKIEGSTDRFIHDSTRMYRGQQGSFKLEGINISDSKDLEDLVIRAINKGPDYIRRLGWGREFNIKNCNFSGVDLSQITIQNWRDPMEILELAKINKGFDIENNPNIDMKIKRISRVRNIFGK